MYLLTEFSSYKAWANHFFRCHHVFFYLELLANLSFFFPLDTDHLGDFNRGNQKKRQTPHRDHPLCLMDDLWKN